MVFYLRYKTKVNSKLSAVSLDKALRDKKQQSDEVRTVFFVLALWLLLADS